MHYFDPLPNYCLCAVLLYWVGFAHDYYHASALVLLGRFFPDKVTYVIVDPLPKHPSFCLCIILRIHTIAKLPMYYIILAFLSFQ